MRTSRINPLPALGILIFLCAAVIAVASQSVASSALDARVEKFLNYKRSDWHDWNVPYQDGKVLHDLIVRNQYTRTLEIGTSSGHPAGSSRHAAP
jgi:caffeoyl-CoA O-methyltransferase